MSSRQMPDDWVPKHPKWKKNPRGAKGLVSEFVLKRLLQGHLTDAQIADECAALYGGSTSVKAVQWYKFQFRKAGLLEKPNKKRRKRRYLTEFHYEIIFKQLPGPDNVEVVEAKQLIEFAKQVVMKYAKTLPKPIDEIVYDVRTAKHYLEATKRFEIIDQNNYDNPFEWREENDEEEITLEEQEENEGL